MAETGVLQSTARVTSHTGTCGVEGRVRLVPQKAAWLAMHSAAGFYGLIAFADVAAVAVFIVMTAVSICAGHSVGMHRLLIHRSFQTYRWLEYSLVWLGTLVGMAGPYGMIRAHDMRDWHQRQVVCPPHPAHDAGFWRDAYWQLCCDYQLSSPPTFQIEDAISRDPFYRFLERTWMIQQVPVAGLLYLAGGWGWVLLGVSLRVSVSLIGHWLVGHYAHQGENNGQHVSDLPVQGSNLPGLGLIAFGENWHGNHHAFPNSARLGIDKGQIDPGFWLIQSLSGLGLVWNIQLPCSKSNNIELVQRQVDF